MLSRIEVDISEVAVCVFVKQWIYRRHTTFYYDWMVRDFFAFLSNYVNGWARPAGAQEQIDLPATARSKA